MSHIVQIQTEIRDPVAVKSACNRMGLPVPIHRTVISSYNAKATGLAVELPNWRYPVVCQTETGEIRYDNYEGRWGEQRHLDRLKQIYAVEKAKSEGAWRATVSSSGSLKTEASSFRFSLVLKLFLVNLFEGFAAPVLNLGQLFSLSFIGCYDPMAIIVLFGIKPS